MRNESRSWYACFLGQSGNRRRQQSHRSSPKHRRRAFLEALENRHVLTVPGPISLPEVSEPQLDHPDALLDSQGWLFITAATNPQYDNRLTISRKGAEVHIHDALLTWVGTAQVPGAYLSADLHTLIVPDDVVFGQRIYVNGGDGNDTLTVDFHGGNPVLPGGLTFNGGWQTGEPGDVLKLEGDTADTVTYRFINKSDGSVNVDGAQIDYTGLEPVPSTITAANVDLFYSDTSETITITDFGGGQTQVNSTAGEVVNFPNPTGRLTVHAGGGDDTILVHGVGAGLTGKLTLSGGLGTDTVSFGDSAPISLGGSLSVAAETVNQTQPLTVAGTTELQPNDYAAEVLRDAPAAYYRFNETSGTAAAPLVGTVNGVYNGGVVLGDTGPLTGHALNYAPIFDGADDFVLISSGATGAFPASLFSDGTYSVEIWFRSRAGANTQDLVAMTAAADNNHGILLETVGTRQLRYLHRSPPGGSGGQQINPSTETYTVNTWNHLVVVNDGSQMRLYLNGMEDTTTAVPAAAVNFAVNAAIGRLTPTSATRHFDGGLDEYAVYDTALTQTQIRNHFNSTAGVINVSLDNPANNFGGAVSVGGGGNVQLADADNLVLGPVTVATGLTVNAAGNVTQTAPILGAGGLTKLGAGTLTLSLANTYSGTTTIRGGKVQTTATNALPTNTAVILGVGTDTGTLDLDADQSIASLSVTSNTATFNTVDIAPNRTLNVTGTGALSVGVSAPGQITNVNFIGGGHLNVSNAGSSTTIFFGLTNTNQNEPESEVTVDMTALGSFTASVENVRVGYNSRVGSVVSLSNTANTITANLLTIGDSTTNNAGSPIEVILGTGTNEIQVNSLVIAAGKGTASMKFASQDAGSPGTVSISGRFGPSSSAAISLGVNTQVGTAANITGTLDLRGHQATVEASTLTMGRGNQASSSGATGNLWFDNGTFSVLNVTMANRSGTGTGPAQANLNIGGGVFTVSESFILGTHTGGAASNGTVNISGGTLISEVDMIDAGGATTTTINLNGGTLDLTGNAIGGSVPVNAVNLQSGVLKNVGEITAVAATKTTAGTVQILGDNALTSTLTVSEGALQVDGTMPDNTTVVQTGGTLRGVGTAGSVVVNPGGIHSPGNGVGIESVAGDYVQHGSLVIEIASPSGTVPGTSYDQVRVTDGGSVALGTSATLVVNYLGTPGTFNPTAGAEYIIIDNDGVSSADTTGSFLGLPNAFTLDIDGVTMQILYNGGDGNDVVLRRFAGGATTLYVNDQFTGTGSVDGDLEAPGTQAATIGVTAFASIAAALAANPNFNGVIVVNGGTYAAAALAGGGGVTLRLVQDLETNEPDVVLQNLTGDGVDSIETRFHGAAGGSLTVEQGTFGGVISGAGDLTKTTAGALTLSGPNGYTGSTTIASGSVTLGANNALPTTTVLTVGSGTTTATFDLDDYSQTIAGLASRSNSTTANVITVAPGQTLTVNGNVSLGFVASSGSSTDTKVTVNGGGALSIIGTTVSVGVASSGQNGGWFNRAVLDVTELGSFSANVTNFLVGAVSGTATVPNANLLLSNTANTIIATTLTVGDTAGNNGSGGNFLILGTGTNVLRADNINIGRGKGSGAGTIRFASQDAGSPGTVNINNKGGTGAANFNIGDNNGVGTAGGAIGTLDLRGHVATVSANTMTLGRLNMGSSTGNTSATLRFDAGTFTVATLNVAPKTSGGTGTSNGLIEIGGGTFTVNTAFTLGSQATAGASIATLNITGGTFTSNANVNRGGGTTTSTITLSGGTFNVTGKNIGSSAAPITLNFTGGTLQNLAQLNDGGDVTKTGTGSATIAGTNNYTGATEVTEGTLQVNGSLAFSPTTVASAATLTGTGTTGPLTVNASGIHAPGDGVGITTVTGNYVQNGALQIQIGSAIGTTPGTHYDQVAVVGGGIVDIGAGGTLAISYLGAAGTFAPNLGDIYVLIDNDGTFGSETTGTFTGLANGATVMVDGISLQLQYNGGDGNDVVLVVTGGPPTLYVNDQFTGSGVVDGDLETSGTQSATIGTTAFASIAAALAANPTFSGVIVVNGGTYASAPLAGGGAVSMRLVQDLENGEPNVIIQNLTGDANDNIATRFVGAANADLTLEQGTFAGVISGAGNLTKLGAGSLTLSGNNTYTGTTVIADGTVVAAANNALSTGPLVLGSGATVGTLDLTNASQTISTLNVSSNSSLNNNIIIGANRTLTTTGNVVIGLNTAANVARLVVSGEGAWTINNTAASGLVAVGGGTSAASHSSAILDLSGLATFTANLTGATSTFRVGDSGTTGTGGATSTALLAANSTIVANSVLVGTNSGSGNTMTLRLGTGTQVIHTNNLEVANRGSGRSRGTLNFQTTTGTLTIRGQGGGTTAATLRIGENSSTTGGPLDGTVDFAGHFVDARFSNVTIGVNGGGNTGNAMATHTHTLTFDTGTLAITGNTQIGTKTNTWQYHLAAALNINGGAATFGGAITIGNHTSTAGTTTGSLNIGGTANVTINGAVNVGGKTGAGGTSTASFNVSGGTVNVSSNVVLGNQTNTGTLTSTLNVTGGTLSVGGVIAESGIGSANSVLKVSGGALEMNGGVIGATIPINTIDLEAGKLDSVAEINDGAAVSKTTAGLLTIEGTNGFTGAMTVEAGTLAVNGTMVSNPTVQSGATLTGTGTTGELTVDAGGTHAPGTNVGVTTVNGDYVENGTLQIQIGSASGTVAGTDYDQVRVLNAGSVTIGAGATLVVTYTGAAGTLNPVSNAVYILINNDGTAPADTVGTFALLPEGETVTVDGKPFAISYVGGDGNDVVLTAMNSVLYVNDQFTGAVGTSVDGDLETGGVQAAVIGTTAFASIAAALAAHPGFSGVIVVNGGTYASALLAGGGNVTLRLVQDGVTEPNIVFGELSGDAGDAIITRFNGTANANLTVGQGSFSGVISGAGTLTKNTSDTLNLLGTNTYTGATTVSGGTLQVTGSIIPSTTTVQTGATLTGAGTTGAVSVNSGGVHLPGVGTGVGFGNVQGSYVQNGGLTIEIGSIAGTTAGTDYDQLRITGGSSTVTLGGTLTLNYTGAPGTFNPTTGAIYRIIDNAGGATTGAFAGLPNNSIITVDGRGMQIQYGAGDGNDVVLVAQAPVVSLYVDNGFTGANGTVVDGDLEAGGMQNAVIGTSAFASVGAALAANTGFTGIIYVNGGVYAAAVNLTASGTGTPANVELRLVQDLVNGESNVTFASLTGDGGDQIITRFHNAANANLVVQSGSFGGVISGAGDVVKSESGTVTLSGANAYTGLTDVQAGVLTITNPTALGTTAGATTVASGGQLRLSGGIVVAGESITINGAATDNLGALNNLSGNNEWAGPIVIGTAGTNNRVGSTAGNLTLSGPISGGQAGLMGGLTVRNGAGTTIVSGGANTYLGDTTIVVGTLQLAGGADRLPVGTKVGIGNSAGVSPAVFDLGGQNQTIAGLYTVVPSSTMVMEVSNSGALATLTVDVAGGTETFGGVITGAVNLTKRGPGVLALTTVGGNNSNTYTGTTLVSGGRLHLNKTAGQNAIPGQLDITTGGLVSFGASNQIADTASVNVSGAASVFNGVGFNAGQLPNLQETIGNITVTGGTFQTGTGANWNVTGTGSFTGGAGNTIFLGNSNSTISFGSLSLTNMTQTPGGTVQTSNSFAIYGGGPAVGTVTVGSGGLALNGSVFNLRRGPAGSRLVLNGDVTATGTSSIIVDPGSGSGGVAQVELSSTAGTANRAFDVTAGGTLTVSAPITDGAATPGSITKAGVGTLVLSGANTYTGTTNVNAGVLQLAGGNAIADAAGAVNVGLGGTLQLLADETISSFVAAGDNVGTNDGTLALGAFTLTTSGSAALADVTGSAGAAIVAGGNITDADDDNNITSPSITLTAASGIGTSGDPIETTVANLEASGGSGGVFLANIGDLVIGGVGAMTGVSATGGGINVSTTGNLTMNENVSGPADVTLSAGDNATLAGNVTSGTAITVNIDFGDVDTAGGVFTLTGTLTAPDGATINGGSNNDTFDLRPQTGAAVTVNGFDPQMTTTGDILNLDLTGAVNQQLGLGSIGAGVWTFDTPLQTVSYTSIEEMNANAPYDLVLDANTAAYGNTGVSDLITIRQSGANLVVERTGAATAPDNDDVGVIFQGAIAPIRSFTYLGSSDDDILTVSDADGLPQFSNAVPSIPDNANLAGTGSILFDGNGGADDLVFQLTGANASLTYAIGSGSGTASTEGEVRVTSGALALQAYVVDTELIERTGMGATPGALSVIGDSGANAIAVTGSGTNTLVSAPGYTSLSFSGDNFNAITIDGLGGADTIELVSLGTGQTNDSPITLSGGLGDDTLRVHSTSGNTGAVTLNGGSGSDHFILQSATNTVDGIVGQVIVDGTDGIVGSNDDRLTIVDSGDATGDTVLVNAINPATSSDYRVEGITSTGGDDVIFRNIDTLTYTGTAGDDTIDARFENTTPAHDLAVATLNGWTGGDQFYLFISDQIGGTAPTPTGTPSGLATITLNGDAPGNPNANDGNDIFGQLPPGIVGTGNPGLEVPDSVRAIRPSASTAITIDGGQPTAPVGMPGDSNGDVLNLDTSGLASTSSLVLATLSGQLAGAGIEPFAYSQIEDLNYITNNQLINLQLGDTLVRSTSGPDTIIFSMNPTPEMPTGTRVRLGTLVVDFPMNGKTLTFAGDGNDYVTHSNVTFPMEIHGEGGNDMLFGGTGNDLLIGGLGNDQISASLGDNILFGDNAPTSSDLAPQDSAIGGDDVLSALGGTDVFYGGGGNDHVSPGAGNDYIYGGEGDDLLDGAQGDDRIYGGGGNDVISGSEGHDLLSGGAGNDLLFGRDGNDILIGGDGIDNLDGGSGDDLLIGANLANQLSSWTSTTNGTTFDSSIYQRATDNDAALLALLTAWSTTGNRSTLAAITDDGVLDKIWGYTGDDDFSATPGEPQDLNASFMGNDETF